VEGTEAVLAADRSLRGPVTSAGGEDTENRSPGLDLALDADQVGQLIDALDDPLKLRRLLAALSRRLVEHDVPEPSRIEADLTEALRRTRSSVRRPGPVAAQRYRALELLIIERLSPAEAAAAQFVSRRSFYRYRQEALVELATSLGALWRERALAAAERAATASQPAEGIPQPRIFLGRDHEVRQLAALVETSRLVLIGGPAGIGKTALGAVVARHVAAKRPVLWHRFRPGLTDTVAGVLFAIGRRLSELGLDALSTFLREASTGSPWELVAQGLAVHGLQEHRVALFLDDGDVVSDNQPVLSLLSSLCAEAPGSRIVVMARERVPLLREAERFEVGGLDEEMVRAYLVANGLRDLPAGTVAALVRETGGNPQVLHLAMGAILHAELEPAALGDRLHDVPDIRAFFFDHIYRHLTETQQLVLGAASLVREPASASFLASALEGLVPSTPATLAELARRFLFSANVEGLRLHSSVREFARRTLAPGHKADLHRHIARGYERIARHDEACHHWIEAGELEAARLSLLATHDIGDPPTQARLRHLATRLHALGLGDDPELATFTARLMARQSQGSA
jgi:hypothetical protein